VCACACVCARARQPTPSGCNLTCLHWKCCPPSPPSCLSACGWRESWACIKVQEGVWFGGNLHAVVLCFELSKGSCDGTVECTSDFSSVCCTEKHANKGKGKCRHGGWRACCGHHRKCVLTNNHHAHRRMIVNQEVPSSRLQVPAARGANVKRATCNPPNSGTFCLPNCHAGCSAHCFANGIIGCITNFLCLLQPPLHCNRNNTTEIVVQA
jgi:hypothetical protein